MEDQDKASLNFGWGEVVFIAVVILAAIIAHFGFGL
jgi:hypothetical protein